MKILVLNGSPKGKRSNTKRITDAFIEGLNSKQNHQVEDINIPKMNIEHCLGCYCCWTKTPGKCIIKDDVHMLIDKYLEADLVVWSFPLYYFGMPSKIKAFLDRLLPTNLPYMTKSEDSHGGHPPRYDLSHQRHVLISTCGFYNVKGNYDALQSQFDIMFHGKLTEILCPEGELFRVPQLKKRINEYLETVGNAGQDYDKSGVISSDTRAQLDELLYPIDKFIQMADASWEINDTDDTAQDKDTSLNFIKQMSAVYDPSYYKGNDIVVEMRFDDIDRAYQLVLGKENCSYRTEDFTEYTTCIETSYDLWREISDGKISGTQAMMEQRYRVLGEFDTMLMMDKYFGTGGDVDDAQVRADSRSKRSPNMLFLLLPWIALWALVPINTLIGSIVAIGVAVLMPIIGSNTQSNIYEKLTVTLVSAIGLMGIAGVALPIVVALSYLVFGALWLVSAFTAVPLCAYYSSKEFGGSVAYSNPLFIRTNKILAILWGVMYLIITGVAMVLIGGQLGSYTGLFCSAGSGIMGGFTAWFANWYPAKIARG